MNELWFSGTIAVLDKPTTDGKTLPSSAHNSWIDLPITVWNEQQPAGVIRNIALLKNRIVAFGTVSDGTLIGRLMRGHVVYVSPNIKFMSSKNLITGVTVVAKPVWESVFIRKK